MLNLFNGAFRIFIFVAALACQNTYANEIVFSGGLSVNNYKYSEFDSNGNSLNTENGVIYGYTFDLYSLRSSLKLPVYFNLNYQRFDDSTPYQGATQAGIPLQSKTEHDIRSVALSLGLAPTKRVNIYGKFGIHERRRVILPTELTTQLTEIYDWFQVGLGASLYFGAKNQWVFSAEAFRVESPDIFIDTHLEDWETIQFPQKGKPGATITIGHTFSLDRWEFKNSAAFTYQAFDASDPHSVQVNNQLYFLEEPKSVTLSRTFTSLISFRW